MNKLLNRFIIALFLALISTPIWANVPNQFVYEGILLDGSDNPVSGSKKFNVKIQIGTDVCYEKSYAAVNVDSGNFKLTIDTTGGAAFSSAPLNCAGVTDFKTLWAKSANKELIISVENTPGTYESFSPIQIDSVPYAMQANQADSVGGFSASNVLRVADAGVPGSAPTLTAAQATELMNLITAASTVYVKHGGAVFTAAPQWAGTPSAVNDLVNKAYVDAAVVAGLPDTGTAGIYTKVTTDAKGRVIAGATLIESDIPSLTTAGKVDGGAINAGTIGGSTAINTSGNIVTSGTVSAGTFSGNQLRVYNGANYVQFTAPNLSGSNVNYVLPAADGSANQVLKTDGAGNLSWTSAAAGGVTGVTASAPLSSSGGAIPNITIAQANTTTAGYLSSADWNTFNDKLGTASPFSGDVSGTSSAMSVDKIKGKDVVPVAYSTGQFLRYDGMNWVNAALTAGDIPAVDTSKITDGTIMNDDVSASAAISRSKMAVGAASHVLINDGSGVMSSEASLAVSRGGTGANIFSGNKLIASNPTGTVLQAVSSCTLGQVVKFDASGNWTCGTDLTPRADAVHPWNTGVGANTLSTVTTGTYNSAFGYLSGFSLTAGSYNSLFGEHAGYGLTSGIKNTFVGSKAGQAIISGSNNTVVGSYSSVAGPSGTTSGSIVLGSNSSAGDNSLTIGNDINNTVANSAIIGGNFTNFSVAQYTMGTANYNLQAAKGSTTAPSFVPISTPYMQLNFMPYDGSNFIPGAQIEAATSATGSNTTKLNINTAISGSLMPRISINETGKVGIGNPAPATALDVNGAIRSSEILIPSMAAADATLGNSFVFQNPSGNIITLTGMVVGAHYTVVITDTTSRTYTFSSCTTSKFSLANGATNNHTIYKIYYSSGGTCYIDWKTGYN